MRDESTGNLLDVLELGGLHSLDQGCHLEEASCKVLASLRHSFSSLGASSLDVLHSLGETGVSESSLLSDGVVHHVDLASELVVELLALSSHVLVELVELLGCSISSGLELGLDLLHDTSEASSRCSVSSLGCLGGSLLLSLNLAEELVLLGLHEGSDIVGLLLESSSVCVDALVGLSDLLAGLDSESR